MERKLNRITPADAWKVELEGADGNYTSALGFAENIVIMGLMQGKEGPHLMEDIANLVNQYNEKFLSPFHEAGGEIYASYAYASRLFTLLKADKMQLETEEYQPASVYSPDKAWPSLLESMGGNDEKALAFAAGIVQAGAEDYAMHRQNTKYDDSDEEGTRRLLDSFVVAAERLEEENGIRRESEYRQIVLYMGGLIVENIAAMQAADDGF